MSAMASTLHLLRPEWLWLLLALPVIAWAWHLRRRRDDAWRNVVDAPLLPHLVDRRVTRRGVASLAVQCIAWTLATVAMAGPSWRSGTQATVGGGTPLVIALDLSDATLAGDLPPSRLLQARARLAQLLHERNGRPTALVAFAGDAFTVSPITEDAANIILFLDALAPDIMPVPGHRPSRAIEVSTLLLSRAGHARGEVLLLTDHADDEAASAAARARAAGYRVSALAMGTPAGAAYRRSDGSLLHAALEADSLSALAAAGGGAVLPWQGGLRLPAMTGDAGDDADASDAGVRTWRDEGYWLLLPLMLLALLAFRRGAAIAVLVLCMWLPLPPAYAMDGNEGGLWRRADQARHARLRDGIDAYRANDFDGALRAWNGLPGAEAAYNRGNALAKQGRFAEAIAAYDAALQARPAMADALANRKAVEAAMQRRPRTGGNPSHGGAGQRQGSAPAQPGTGGDAGAGSDAAPGEGSAGNADAPRQDRSGADTSRAQQQPQQPQAPLPDDVPASDAEAQRAADQAQRERMQRAMEQQGTRQTDDGQRVEGRPERAESAAEREKRQANAAWLRRIPDDPGGVLRARFRLEHERRSGKGDTP